ncbi:MAG: diaminopimelate decarboxylase, partial [Anaerolineae bacterium]|nr:diaminopimelate decarboxylase [Anaerolineae bacterium]
MSNKLSLFPPHTTITTEGQLTLNGHAAVELARQFGTPLYVYDVATIRQQIRAYRQGLARYAGSSLLT